MSRGRVYGTAVGDGMGGWVGGWDGEGVVVRVFIQFIQIPTQTTTMSTKTTS
jgi:hypothetical protein